MVAAWIRAETGVGPAMASGSQTCSGNWADLPIAPQNRPMPINVARLKPNNVKSDAKMPAWAWKSAAKFPAASSRSNVPR